MASGKVIPFRRRTPHELELQAYRHITRNWSDAMKRLICPQLYYFDQELKRRVARS